MSLVGKILRDYRVVYVILLVLVAAALVTPLGLPLLVSKEVKTIYDHLESIPPGSNIGVGSDFMFETFPEMGDSFRALFRYCLKKNLNFICINTDVKAQGNPLVEQVFREVSIPKEKKYGVDYVNLGFLPGEEAALANFAKDVQGTAVRDARGTPISELPIMKNVKTMKDFALWFGFGGVTGDYPERYLRQIQVPYKIGVAYACQAGVAPTIKPYVASGQLLGLLSSVRGGAEFELITGMLGGGAVQMDSLSLSHMFMLLVIIAGNIYWFGTRSGRENR